MLGPGDNMPSFKELKSPHKDGSVFGNTQLEALNCILPPTSPTDKPLQLPLHNVYKSGGLQLITELN